MKDFFSLESRAPRAAAETAGEGMKEHEEREGGVFERAPVFSLPLFTHDKVASSAMEKGEKKKKKKKRKVCPPLLCLKSFNSYLKGSAAARNVK